MANPAKAERRKATGLNPQGYGRRAAESRKYSIYESRCFYRMRDFLILNTTPRGT